MANDGACRALASLLASGASDESIASDQTLQDSLGSMREPKLRSLVRKVFANRGVSDEARVEQLCEYILNARKKHGARARAERHRRKLGVLART